MSRMFWERDAEAKALEGQRIAVIGYGSQGRAQALNLRDSRCDVILGLRRGGPTWARAEADGWQPREPREAAGEANVVAMLAPDMAQPEIYQTAVAPHLRAGSMLLFSHGFNIHYRQIEPPGNVDVTLIAPKGPGDLVRRQYLQGRGVPCLLAVHQDPTGTAQKRALTPHEQRVGQ